MTAMCHSVSPLATTHTVGLIGAQCCSYHDTLLERAITQAVFGVALAVLIGTTTAKVAKTIATKYFFMLMPFV